MEPVMAAFGIFEFLFDKIDGVLYDLLQGDMNFGIELYRFVEPARSMGFI